MSEAGQELIAGMAELLGIVTGARPAGRIHINGFAYVPEDRWEPIETAPKNWSDILLHDPDLSSDFRTVCEGYYDQEAKVWKSAMFGVISPTHWMPLPEPPKVTWKQVLGWPAYEISDRGEVRSLPRLTTRRDGTTQTWRGKPLTRQRASSGYLVVRLSDAANGRRRVARVHRLVAEAFLSNPFGYTEVNHIDGNKLNARAENLEWCSTKHNALHSARTRLNPVVGLSDEQVVSAREAFAAGESIRSITRRLGRDRKGVRAMLRGESYTWLPSPPVTEETK